MIHQMIRLANLVFLDSNAEAKLIFVVYERHISKAS